MSDNFENVKSKKKCKYFFICNNKNCKFQHSKNWDFSIGMVKYWLNIRKNAYTSLCNKKYGECKFAKDCRCLFDCEEQWDLYPRAYEYLNNRFNKNIPASEENIDSGEEESYESENDENIYSDEEESYELENDENTSRAPSRTSEIANEVNNNMKGNNKPKKFLDSNTSYSSIVKNSKSEATEVDEEDRLNYSC